MLQTAKKATREAEKIVMNYFNEEKDIKEKSEIDLVTKADVEAEKKIVEIIKEEFPNHGFILEEQDNFNQDSEYIWVIDPIDGTTSFAHNYPMFSISIALFKNNQPVLGVVSVPYMKELFWAEKGKGAFLNGKKIFVSDTKTLRESLVATGFPYGRLSSKRDNLDYFNKIAKYAQGLRRSGSAAIDVCYVACGRVDAYWELDLKIMDTAAAGLILNEAGGRFTDLQRREIKENYTNIVATNGKVHDELIKRLSEVMK